ncbi:EamA domain-containing membrane protein RarD [Malonomonas rubra DSM 5091]|uniref:EamA domain-containing membrane protein RarD n=2 Tax=Malonomonas rubra TaxID=57040 RepID=A0A1M6K1Y4_MALRU|nr:EamA domain-containing membrane protein RarD [Malonomonas rubra DSM 5091]
MGRSEHTKGLLIAIAGVLILSPDALMVRLIDADIWSLLFWRCLLTALTTSLLLFLNYRSRFLQSFRAVGTAGLYSASTILLGSILFVNSLKQTAAANTLIILAATPVISSLFSYLFLKEKIARRTWLAIFCCFGGIVLIFSGSLSSGFLLGDFLALGATCMWATNLVILRSGKEVNMIPANVIGNLSVLPIALLCGAAPLQVSPQDASLLLLLGGLLLPVSFALITIAPRYLPAPEVSLILLIETILGPIWVWLVLHEIPESLTLVAGCLILTTLLIHTLLGMRAGKAA